MKSAALAVVSPRMTTSDSSAYRVETTSRLAQWRIDNLPSYTYRKSVAFKMGKWKWHLAVERSSAVFVKLYPEVSSHTRENPPTASFLIRVLCSAADRNPLSHPEVRDKQIKSSDDFVWTIDQLLFGNFIIDLEFLDLKTPLSQGGDPHSIWADTLFPKHTFDSAALSSLSTMLSHAILTDISIITSDGATLSAHRAVLAARSPVFRSMFTHDLKEKHLSAVTIPDMSTAACQAFVSYLYGSIGQPEFVRHRLALLGAADKYGVGELRDACHASLLEDIDTGNVLERLESAWLYRLEGLKAACLRFLVRFGKVCDIAEEFKAFVQCADRELVSEVFAEILTMWKGFN